MYKPIKKIIMAALFIIFVMFLYNKTSALISNYKPTDTAETNTATLVRVIDGDTLIVNLNNTETKIRLIGIDTPESVNSDASKNNEYGKKASEYTKQILSGHDNNITLTYDKEKTDKYGRTLAYVWLTTDTNIVNSEESSVVAKYMLNAILVNDGYAFDKVYMPNNKYAKTFKSLKTNAQNIDTGLWKYEEFENLWK